MRQHIRDFIAACSRELPIQGPIYEFGARAVPGQDPDKVNLRPFFEGMEFHGVDIDEGVGVDVVMNVCDIDLPGESVGTIICVESLEHVRYPWMATQEMYRILKPDGIAILSSTMFFQIHHKPDYWRYTPEGFRVLMEPFDNFWVDWSGDPEYPHTVVAVGIKGKLPIDFAPFAKELEDERILWKLDPGMWRGIT